MRVVAGVLGGLFIAWGLLGLLMWWKGFGTFLGETVAGLGLCLVGGAVLMAVPARRVDWSATIWITALASITTGAVGVNLAA